MSPWERWRRRVAGDARPGADRPPGSESPTEHPSGSIRPGAGDARLPLAHPGARPPVAHPVPETQRPGCVPSSDTRSREHPPDDGSRRAHLPPWVKAPAREVCDAHWLAHADAEKYGPDTRAAKVVSVLEWVTDELPTEREAEQMMMASDGGAFDTIVWLFGVRPAPIDVPRRNADGSLKSVDELIGEYMEGKHNGPEERRDADRWARKQATRSRWLAEQIPY